MLENIKLILNITDHSQDQLILLYMTRITTIVLKYCNLKTLNAELECFVEDKITSIIKNRSNSNVKSVTRGDTKIEYVTNSSDVSILNDSDKEFLNTYCVVKLC